VTNGTEKDSIVSKSTGGKGGGKMLPNPRGKQNRENSVIGGGEEKGACQRGPLFGRIASEREKTVGPKRTKFGD